MSFILDALRKSEIERQRQSGPSMAEFPAAREDRRLPVALIAIGFLLAINVAVVLFFMAVIAFFIVLKTSALWPLRSST